jgi:hypothetical protein
MARVHRMSITVAPAGTDLVATFLCIQFRPYTIGLMFWFSRNRFVARVGAGLKRARSRLSGDQSIGRFRRRRRAFDLARTCQGASRAVQLGACRERAKTDAERVAADIFSNTIREYSAGEQLPRAIMRLR